MVVERRGRFLWLSWEVAEKAAERKRELGQLNGGSSRSGSEIGTVEK